MTVEVRTLEALTAADLSEFLDGGYSSSSKYLVQKTEDAKRTVITAELTELTSPYVKHWEYKDTEELSRYQDYIRQGHSLGAYDCNALIALALCETRNWNRTLWLWEFHVAPTHRRKGIGRMLMNAVVGRATANGFRAIGLETQSTNVPGIAFYRSVGFELDGIDLSFYTNTDAIDGEVAFFMRMKL